MKALLIAGLLTPLAWSGGALSQAQVDPDSEPAVAAIRTALPACAADRMAVVATLARRHD